MRYMMCLDISKMLRKKLYGLLLILAVMLCILLCALQDVHANTAKEEQEVKTIVLNMLVLNTKNKEMIDKFIRFYVDRGASFQHRVVLYHPYQRGKVIAEKVLSAGRDDLSSMIMNEKLFGEHELHGMIANSVKIEDDRLSASVATKLYKSYKFDINVDQGRSFWRALRLLDGNLDIESVNKLQENGAFKLNFDVNCNFALGKSSTFVIYGYNCASTVTFG